MPPILYHWCNCLLSIKFKVMVQQSTSMRYNSRSLLPVVCNSRARISQLRCYVKPRTTLDRVSVKWNLIK